MISLEDALTLARQHCRIYWSDLGDQIYGIYYRESGIGCIGLCTRIRNDSLLAKSTLAEEYGHHWTSPPGNYISPRFSFAERVDLGRTEQRAITWGANWIISDSDMMYIGERLATMEVADEVAILSEILHVTPDMIKAKWKSIVERQLIQFSRLT